MFILPSDFHETYNKIVNGVILKNVILNFGILNTKSLEFNLYGEKTILLCKKKRFQLFRKSRLGLY